MNDLALAWNIITSPTTAFAELRERPRFLAPLFALLIGGAGMLLWYYSVVDIEWLKDHMFSGNERIQQMSDAQRERMMSMMSRKGMTSSGVIVAVISLPMVLAVQAGYYMLAGKVTGMKHSFMQWFSLVTWAAVPSLVGVLAAFVVLLTDQSQGQISPGELQTFSLNNLFFQRAPNQSGFQLLSTLNLISFWAWGLIAVGVRVFGGKSWLSSIIFAVLPFVVLYGSWTLWIFAR
jgi:hypothetical protein